MDENRRELMEVYKLHAELADRVSQRRAGANRLYVSLLTGVLVFFVASLKYGSGEISNEVVFVGVGIIGAIVSVSWFVVIRSYRQLNTGKFAALHELEEKLAYPFFKREWELLEKGENRNRYWKLSVVETFLPVCFLVLSSALILWGVLCF